MNSKERMIKTLNFEKPDRIGRYDQFWAETSKKYIDELGLPAGINLEEYFDIDLYKPGVLEEPFPSLVKIISENDSETVQRNGYGMIVRKKKDKASGTDFSELLEPIIKEYSDIDKLVFEDPHAENRFESVLKVVKDKPDRCVFAKIGGPFLRTEFLRGEVQYLMDIAEDPKMVIEMAERVNDHLLELGKEAIKRCSLYDTGVWIFDDMAYNNGPLISPKSFEIIFLPLYKKLVGGLKKAGAKFVLFHSDGNITPLLDMLIDSGIDGINPIEPKAGMSLVDLKKKYGRKLSFIGGICNSDVLVNGPAERIENQVRSIIEVAGDGGVAIGTHSVGVDIPLRNYLVYHETLIKYGQF